MPRILLLGMSALDAIYRVPAIPAKPTKVLASSFTECGGGMAANASVAVARLGGTAHYWGRLGDDAMGDRILADLVREGIDVDAVRRVPGCASPSAAILIADDGERLLCTYNDPRLGADPSWLPLDRVASFDAVMTDVRWPEGAAAVLDAARRAGKLAVFDGDVGPVEALLDLARRATHVAFSELGLARATGADQPGEGLRRIARETDAWVGVTLGADGFLWRDGATEHRAPAPAVKAIDTLGAGDVWHGAFTLALAERMAGRCCRPLRQRRGRDQVHALRRARRRTAPRRGRRAARRLTALAGTAPCPRRGTRNLGRRPATDRPRGRRPGFVPPARRRIKRPGHLAPALV